MQIKTCLTLLAVALVGFTSAQVPIPTRPDGYGVGGPADTHVVVEMFLDPLCPDCKASWPTVLQVIQAYGLHVVANVTNRNLDAIFQYATKVFENQQMWYNDATKSLTMPQVADSLATFVAQTGLVAKDKFLAGLASDDLNYETRVSWKYACSRGVVGTPTFLINGVATSADASWSLADWKSVIDPILASNGIDVAQIKTCPPNQKECTYAPGKTQCCLAGENCIQNVGCRCFNLKNGNKCT